jgi:hypothetical protein
MTETKGPITKEEFVDRYKFVLSIDKMLEGFDAASFPERDKLIKDLKNRGVVNDDLQRMVKKYLGVEVDVTGTPSKKPLLRGLKPKRKVALNPMTLKEFTERYMKAQKGSNTREINRIFSELTTRGIVDDDNLKKFLNDRKISFTVGPKR